MLFRNGRTLAFRQEILAALDSLAEPYLPHFGGLLLLFAAAGPYWAEEAKALPPGPADGADRESVLAGLAAIHRLPPEERSDLVSKVTLIRTVLPDPAPEETSSLSLVRLRLLVDLPARSTEPDAEFRWNDDSASLRSLARGIARFHPRTHSLRRRYAPGLRVGPALFGLPEIPDLPSRRIGRRIEEVTRETGRSLPVELLGRLGETLSSTLDRWIEARGVFGEVSGLSHRGDLDRLLSSELALDPDLFAARLALNEALYLDRRPTPQRPVLHLNVLVDVGVRMWGTPRLLAAAVSLALLIRAPSDACVNVYVCTPQGARRVEPETTDGLLHFLDAYESLVHPGRGLPLPGGDGDDGEAETLILTHPATKSDTDFRRCLLESGTERYHLVAVDRFGGLSWTLHIPAGPRELLRTRIDLRETAASPDGRPPAVLEEMAGRDLPALVLASVLPFRFALSPDPALAVVTEGEGAVWPARDGRLLRVKEPGATAEEITARLGPGRPTRPALERSRVSLVLSSDEGMVLTSVELTRRGVKRWPLPPHPRPPHTVHRELRHTYVLFNDRIDVVEHDDPFIRSYALPRDLHHFGGAYFRCGGSFYRLNPDASGSHLAPVVLPYRPGVRIAAVADVPGVKGQIAVGEQGEIYRQGIWTVPGLPVRIGPAWKLAGVASDGSRIVLRTESGIWSVHLSGDIERIGEEGLRSALDPRGFLARTGTGDEEIPVPRGVRVDGAGVALETEAGNFRLRTEGEDAVLQPEGAADFRPLVPVPVAAGVRQQVVGTSWPDGRRIFADPRGLLHIRPRNRSRPELSILLRRTGPLALWLADGRTAGPRELLARPPTSTGRELVRELSMALTELSP